MRRSEGVWMSSKDMFRCGSSESPNTPSMLCRGIRRLLTVLVLYLITALPAGAQDQDRARDAVRDGQVRPLATILPQVRDRFPGRMLDARLVQRGGGSFYVLKILGANGQVSEVTVDAASGAVRGVR